MKNDITEEVGIVEEIDLDMRIFCILTENPEISYKEARELALIEIQEEREYDD